MPTYNLTIPPDLTALSDLAQALEAFADHCALPDKLRFELALVLEEVVVNVIRYGFPEGASYPIEINMNYEDGQINIVIVDSGQPFDPLVAPVANVDAPLEERPVGGLGIYLVRALMDEVQYQRIEGRNQLFLKKYLR